jgi:phi13 family phage major tail protein
MPQEKKIQFGVSDVAYSVYDDSTGEYGAWVPLPGCTQLTLSPEGSTDSTYADNITFYTSVKNSGYTGSVTLLSIPDSLRTDVFGEVNKSGLLYEITTAIPKTVALRFRVDGNVRTEITILYNVTLARPSGDNSTNEDSLSIKNYSMDITASGRDFTVGGVVINVVKATVENSTEGAKTYAKVLSEVVTPETDLAA